MASQRRTQGGWKWRDVSPGTARAIAYVMSGESAKLHYWRQLYKKGPSDYATLEDFLVGFWEAFFLSRDANDLLAQLETWFSGDIGATPGCDGDRERALGRIKARALILPAKKDLYFPPEDSEWEASKMPNAEVRVIPGYWGHFSVIGMFPEPAAFIEDCVRELLAS